MKTKKLVQHLLIGTLFLSSISAVAATELVEPTGLDQIQEIISNDSKIAKKVSAANIAKAQESIPEMNRLIREAIFVNGLANDGSLSIADSREINAYLVENYSDIWGNLRGTEGYALVERRTSTTIMAKNAVRTVWGGIYDLGFESRKKNKRLTNYKGRKSGSFTSVGYDLGQVMKAEASAGILDNADFQEVEGTTQTNLDSIVTAILTDSELIRKISTGDIRIGATSADGMNTLIIEGIIALGLGNDEKLTAADMRTLNAYLVENHQSVWSELHGDDENEEETGFHKVQKDGAFARMFATNVVNSIADGIYHLGFATNNKNRLKNEDGNNNKRFELVAWWLDTLLKEDLLTGKLSNPEFEETVGETGTTMDNMIRHIYGDAGLVLKVSMEDIRVASSSANEMNKLIVEAMKATGVTEDNHISTEDVKALNQYLVDTHEARWAILHGDDEDNEETGYHRIQNDGAIGIMNGKNHINTLADGVYHLGFKTPYKKRLVNEDGNKNVSFRALAYWLNKALARDLQNGSLKN